MIAGRHPADGDPAPDPARRASTDVGTGLIDCGNWGVSASWTVPTTAVSGVYIAHLVRTTTPAATARSCSSCATTPATPTSLVPDLRRDLAGLQHLRRQQPLQLHRRLPAGQPAAATRAPTRSPTTGRSTATSARQRAGSDPFYAEYPMIRFLERNGYDVSYTARPTSTPAARCCSTTRSSSPAATTSTGRASSGPTSRRRSRRRRQPGLLQRQRDLLEDALGPSIDGTNTPYRTLVTYKETHFNAPIDPQDPPTWTGAWRDPTVQPAGRRRQPGERADRAAVHGQLPARPTSRVPSTYSKLRFWRNTAVAKLTAGQTRDAGAGTGTLGYEWDEDADNGFRPAGEFDLSSTTVSGAPGVHRLRHAPPTHRDRDPPPHPVPGAERRAGVRRRHRPVVLGPRHTNATRPAIQAPPDRNMQQATVNLFADMGAQPTTLIAGLVAATASTDTTPPTSTITRPTAGATVADGSQ